MTSKSSFGRSRAMLVAAAVAAAVGVSAQAAHLLQGLEGRTVDARFQLRGHQPQDELVVVAIDSRTFSELRLSWPFRRSLHGRVVDRLHAASAREIVLDVQFTEPTKLSEDLALYDAIERAGGRGARDRRERQARRDERPRWE